MNSYNRNYQRSYLRAPFLSEVLGAHQGAIYKLNSINISVGGLLLSSELSLPLNSEFHAMFSLPTFPYFKNFSIERLRSFSSDLIKAPVVKVKYEVRRVMRQEGEIFNLALMAKDLRPIDKELIENYVNTYVSNIIYLQTLLEQINSHPHLMEFLTSVCDILGYDHSVKLSLLNKQILSDYRSLQWI